MRAKIIHHLIFGQIEYVNGWRKHVEVVTSLTPARILCMSIESIGNLLPPTPSIAAAGACLSSVVGYSFHG
ncbi:hypothetical protein JOC54_004633 [Alkalihalobacillus xiaoxiensis]|uniref:Uncharacterized protein n=1 Tax=Shouchella xiaoxiensis TaxID=766895 RepID=A0ABS2T3N6_9BACI|nr:hypothetical protein [Shouchella xiaoxiensis]